MSRIENFGNYYRQCYDVLFLGKTKLIRLCIISLILMICIYLIVSKNVLKEGFSFSASQWGKLERLTTAYSSVTMPCIEPHCDIDCSLPYDSIHSASLSKIQQQHLMIDMGKDEIVEELINSFQPPKTCLYTETQNISSKNNPNISLTFYPLIFGFVDHYLPKSIRRKILFGNQTYTVDQICLPKKSRDFSELIPGRIDTYRFIFENELDYRRLYSSSYFAITMKKAGWDCNRHYEIISSGTIPYFDKLDEAGNHTLSHLPKPLLYEAQRIVGINRQNLTIDHKLFDINHYNMLLHRLLYYAKHRLTTTKIAEYILKTIKYSLAISEKHSVLYIAHEKSDYMKDLMLHGFTRIFEEDLHVFRPPKFMYYYPTSKIWSAKETEAYYGDKLYGFGFGYKLALKKYIHLFERDAVDLSSEAIVRENIAKRKYSLIIFGSIHRSNALFTDVRRHYEPSRIVIIDGDDAYKMTTRPSYAKYGTYFLREIPNNCDEIM